MNTKQLRYNINKIKKNFGYIKAEVELRGEPLATFECDYCGGNGEFENDYGDIETCDDCDGLGRISTENNGETLSELFLANLKKEKISDRIFIFWDIYRDPSVDYELTYTIKTENAHLMPKIAQCFIKCFENYNSRNAGYHIAVLNESYYPQATNTLAMEKVENFKNEVTKLIPALILLGSNHNKTRSFYFRKPQIDRDKYSFIHILKSGFEYRFFDACLDNPEKVLDYIKVIAKTLDFYSNKKVKDLYKSFKINLNEYPEGRRQSVYKAYKSKDNYEALQNTLKVIDRKYKLKFKPSKKKKLNAYDQWEACRKFSNYRQTQIDYYEKNKNTQYKRLIEAKKAKEVMDQDLTKISAMEYIEAKQKYDTTADHLKNLLYKNKADILKDFKRIYLADMESYNVNMFMPNKSAQLELKGGL
jgi:hypothetical protein